MTGQDILKPVECEVVGELTDKHIRDQTGSGDPTGDWLSGNRSIREPQNQNGFQVGLSVNLNQPKFAPSLRPTPERIGTTTMLFPVSAVMPTPPTR